MKDKGAWLSKHKKLFWGVLFPLGVIINVGAAVVSIGVTKGWFDREDPPRAPSTPTATGKGSSKQTFIVKSNKAKTTIFVS